MSHGSQNEHNRVFGELKAREPIFHHPDKFGTSEEDVLKQMCDEFFEVGASGKTCTKEDIIDTLMERYHDPSYQDIFEASDLN